MDPNDREQTELLRHIWNEMKALGTNLGGRIDRVSDRLDGVSERLDGVSDRLDRTRTELKAEIAGTNERLDRTNERLDHANERLEVVEETLHELAAQQLMLGRYVKNAADRQGGAIDELRERVTLIEARLEPKR